MAVGRHRQRAGRDAACSRRSPASSSRCSGTTRSTSRRVFWHTLWTKVWLGVVFGVAVLRAAVRQPRDRAADPPGGDGDPEPARSPRARARRDRARTCAGSCRWAPAPSPCSSGCSVSGNWQAYLLWRNASGISFGNPEPLFRRDPAFYMFSLPWLRFLQGWLFSSLIGVTLLVAIAPRAVGRHPAAGAGVRRQGDPGGARAPVGAARPRDAREGVGLLARPVRPAYVAARGGRGRLLHGGEGAAAGAQLPVHRRGDLRGAVLPQHPDEAVGAAGRGRRRCSRSSRCCSARRTRRSSSSSRSSRTSSSSSSRTSWTTSPRRVEAFGLSRSISRCATRPRRAVGGQLKRQPHDGVEHPPVASGRAREELRRRSSGCGSTTTSSTWTSTGTRSAPAGHRA